MNSFKQQSDSNAYFRIGFGKGRGFREVLNKFSPKEIDIPSNFLLEKLPGFKDEFCKLIFVQVRQSDLPWLLSNNYIDLAIGSSIWFQETILDNVQHIFKTNIASGRLSLIIRNEKNKMMNFQTICTRFPSLTSKWLNQMGYYDKQILEMEGSHEVALFLGFADGIVDIISSGNTVKSMNLVEVQKITDLEHGVWIRKNTSQPKRKMLLELFPSVSWEL